MAASVARVATELARQVVRSELSVRPALVAQVAREAVNAVLMSARHITVQVHPDDHALVAAGCQEALAARGARLLSQPALARGGCKVESDAGEVDARIGARWAQATHALGTTVPWDNAAPGAAADASGQAAAGAATLGATLGATQAATQAATDPASSATGRAAA
jgi:flagellar assembly protein FliH